MSKILLLIFVFGFFELLVVLMMYFPVASSQRTRDSEISSDRFPARGVRSVQGIEVPFHDPYDIEQARNWIDFHGNVEEFYSIEELLEIQDSQNSVTVTGKPPKSPLLRPKKLRIISTHFTRTDLLKIQYFSIKRFVQDYEWEYIVVNSAFDSDSKHFPKNIVLEKDIKKRINEVTESFSSPKVKHVNIPEEAILSYVEKRSDPASRCVNVIQWSLDNLVWGFDGYVIFLDADSFFYDEINIGKLFVDHDIIIGGRNNYRIIKKKKYDFVTNNLLMIDPKRLPDHEEFRFGRVINENVDIDAGAETYNYFSSHPEIHEKWFILYQTVLEYPRNIANNIDHLDPSIQRFFLEDLARFFGKKESYFTHVTEELRNVHYKRGSNWDKRSIDWQIQRGKFWMDFWIPFFGCEDENCSQLVDRTTLKQLNLEITKLKIEIEDLKREKRKKCS